MTDKDRSIEEFLQVLIEFTKANLEHLKTGKITDCQLGEYRCEMQIVAELINSFDFTPVEWDESINYVTFISPKQEGPDFIMTIMPPPMPECFEECHKRYLKIHGIPT